MVPIKLHIRARCCVVCARSAAFMLSNMYFTSIPLRRVRRHLVMYSHVIMQMSTKWRVWLSVLTCVGEDYFICVCMYVYIYSLCVLYWKQLQHSRKTKKVVCVTKTWYALQLCFRIILSDTFLSFYLFCLKQTHQDMTEVLSFNFISRDLIKNVPFCNHGYF